MNQTETILKNLGSKLEPSSHSGVVGILYPIEIVYLDRYKLISHSPDIHVIQDAYSKVNVGDDSLMRFYFEPKPEMRRFITRKIEEE